MAKTFRSSEVLQIIEDLDTNDEDYADSNASDIMDKEFVDGELEDADSSDLEEPESSEDDIYRTRMQCMEETCIPVF